MATIRLIPRLDIKSEKLIKGVHLEGVRVVGDPQEFARRYYEKGADELLYMDAVASLYGRNNLGHIIKRTVQDVFVPITVGGGIRTLDDVKHMLRSGADKVAINTAAVARPKLITEVSKRFGSQCMVLSIEAKRQSQGEWEAYTDNGREHTGLDVVSWAQHAVQLGAGEILLTSIDCEGTGRGFDLELINAVSSAVPVPVIASGGMGNVEHLVDAVNLGRADAIAMADILHYNKSDLMKIRQGVSGYGVEVRKL